MNGVHIVNTINEPVTGLGFSVGGLILAIIAILVVIGTIILIVKTQDWEFLLYGFVLALIFSGVSWVKFNETIIGYHDRYEAYFDDTVTINELSKKYEIVGRRGELYVLDPIDGEVYQK